MIWRIGTEILWHHSQSSMKEFSCFMEQMKTLGVKRYLKVSVLKAALMVFHIDLNTYSNIDFLIPFEMYY